MGFNATGRTLRAYCLCLQVPYNWHAVHTLNVGACFLSKLLHHVLFFVVVFGVVFVTCSWMFLFMFEEFHSGPEGEEQVPRAGKSCNVLFFPTFSFVLHEELQL